MGCLDSKPVHAPQAYHRPYPEYGYAQPPPQPCGPAPMGYQGYGYGQPPSMAYGHGPGYTQPCYGQPGYAPAGGCYGEPPRSSGITPGMAAAGAGVAGLVGGVVLAEALDDW
mmetsp:Transcript_82929/g.209051  ORF Transcript_82929/g.209051 Transcript_82929/m.209051 type:complete len:112 (+) Transcript_82929:93-428(+)